MRMISRQANDANQALTKQRPVPLIVCIACFLAIVPSAFAQIPEPVELLSGTTTEMFIPAGMNAMRLAPEPVQAPLQPVVPGIVPLPLPAEELSPSGAALPEGLTLDQAIDLCLMNDPRIRAGMEIIRQARGDAWTASLPPNPSVFTDGQLMALTRRSNPKEQGGPPQSDVITTYPIDWFLFGKRAAAMVVASRGIQITEADYADLIRRRVLETTQAFYDVLEASATVDVASQGVKNLERVEFLTRNAVEAGGRPQVELSRVRLDLLQSRQALRQAELGLVRATAHLRSLLGRADADPEFAVNGSLDVQQYVEPLQVEDAFQLALQNRPDLFSLRWRVAQASANVDLQRRAAYPEVAPAVGFTRQYQQTQIGFPDYSSWSAAVTASIPLFDRNQGNRAKASAAMAQSRFELRSGEVELRAEITALSKEFRVIRANVDAVSHEQLQLATQVRDSINQAYEIGGRPLIDVLDAQRNYQETYRTFISTRASYWRILYQFNAAVGQRVFP